MILPLACIVEGNGDVPAVPIVIRRVIEVVNSEVYPEIQRPIRIPRSRLMIEGELEKAVDLAIRGLPEAGVVLVVIDADDDCPKEVAPVLLTRAAKAAAARRPVGLVLAKYEFENWFIAAADSIAGHAGLRDDLTAPAEPESIRGAKEWLRRNMRHGRTYSETVDQPSMASRFNLGAARGASSFDKMYGEIERFCRHAVALAATQEPNKPV